MQPYDMKTLGERLTELAEVFGAKPVSEKGLTVWFNVLREFPTEKVCGVLLGWARSHSKMPSPAEVWKSVNEMCTSEREKKAAQENRTDFHPGVSGAKAGEFIAQMKKILNQPNWTPMDHWRRNLKRFPAGHIGHEYAKAAMKKKGVIQDREPGQDDEEKAVQAQA